MAYGNLFRRLDLQLFAEGGAGEGTSAAGQTGVTSADAGQNGTGVKAGKASSSLADVKYGIQDDEVAPAAQDSAAQKAERVEADDREAQFEKLIKGEYKDLYDRRMQDTIQKRLKGTKETVDRYEALLPTLELLQKKYGVKDGDAAALAKAIEDDDTFFEDEALERGISVEQLKQIRKMERENAELKRQMSERETQDRANRLYASWMEQAQSAKAVYPSFDLDAEMKNPKFIDLLRANVDVRTAYEVLHKDDIIPAAMQFTAKSVEQKLSNSIRAGGARPSEGAMNSTSSAVYKPDVSTLTKEDRAEIIRRVARGEKIRF